MLTSQLLWKRVSFKIGNRVGKKSSLNILESTSKEAALHFPANFIILDHYLAKLFLLLPKKQEIHKWQQQTLHKKASKSIRKFHSVELSSSPSSSSSINSWNFEKTLTFVHCSLKIYLLYYFTFKWLIENTNWKKNNAKVSSSVLIKEHKLSVAGNKHLFVKTCSESNRISTDLFKIHYPLSTNVALPLHLRLCFGTMKTWFYVLLAIGYRTIFFINITLKNSVLINKAK